MTLRPVAAEILYFGRRTDMTKLTVTFSQLCGRAYKVVPVHAMTACRENRGIAPLILNHGARYR